MIATLLLAQILSSTPVPVIKAETGQTRTLADVARERKLGIKPKSGGTMSVAGAHLNAPAVGAATAEADAFQAAWIKRNAEVRGELAAAQEAEATAAASMPQYIASGRGSSATQAVLDSTRDGALLPYRARVNEAQAKVDALAEAARRAGAHPGWVRPTNGDESHGDRKIGPVEYEKLLNNGGEPLPARDREVEK